MPSQDGRSPEAILLRRTRLRLIAHVGGKPSETQRQLIERVGMLTIHIARMDAKAIEEGGFSEWASRQYLAWSNTLSRTLRDLGLHSAADRPPNILDHIATLKVGRAAQA